MPDQIPYYTLNHLNQRKNFEIAFTVAESIGIPQLLVSYHASITIPSFNFIVHLGY